MHIELLDVIVFPLVTVCVLSIGYLLFSLMAVERIRYRNAAGNPGFQPPVTIFKPVCGLDPDMAACLRSFCEQDYPEYQVIFGLQDHDDPALPVINTLAREFSDFEIAAAGKTGTAEYCDNFAQARNLCIPGNWPTHAWTIGYAPFDDPEIVVVAFVYNGGEGASVAGPIVKRVLEAYFEIKALEAPGS